MKEFQTLLTVVCAVSALGAFVDGKNKQNGLVALFALSGILFLVSWFLTK